MASALRSGRRGPGFKSRHPDHYRVPGDTMSKMIHFISRASALFAAGKRAGCLVLLLCLSGTSAMADVGEDWVESAPSELWTARWQHASVVHDAKITN